MNETQEMREGQRGGKRERKGARVRERKSGGERDRVTISSSSVEDVVAPLADAEMKG
jgi:hypothetical protein